MTIMHQIQQGKVTTTNGSTDVKFHMPDSEVMHVSISGTCDPRINAAYACLFANLPFFAREPHACMAIISKNCDVKLL